MFILSLVTLHYITLHYDVLGNLNVYVCIHFTDDTALKKKNREKMVMSGLEALSCTVLYIVHTE